LKDVVRVVRRFRPHVMVAAFSGTARDGHGQHRLSALLARRAFAIAGDSMAFSELGSEERLAPWTPLKLYRSTRFDSAATTLVLPTGGLDPRSGRTHHQIAMASRSQHRSQDFGVLQPTGPARTRFARLESRVEHGADQRLFDGIPRDTSWAALFGDSLRAELSPKRLADAVQPLLAALRRARRDGLPDDRRRLLEEALTVAAGLVLDATASHADLVPGQTFDVRVDLYNGGPLEVVIEDITVLPARGAEIAPASEAASSARVAFLGARLEPGTLETLRTTHRVSATASLTQPYFLAAPLRGELYDWSAARPEERGLPFGPPLMAAVARVQIDGVTVHLSREITHRFREQAVGEIRRPLRIVPAVDVRVAPRTLVWSSAGPRSKTLSVTLTANVPDTLTGSLRFVVDGWPVPEDQPFRLERLGERRSYAFTVERPLGVERQSVSARVVARTSDGRLFDHGIHDITYPHIRPVSWLRPARAAIHIAPITLPTVRRVGYVRGASDRVPEALRGIGVPLDLLDAQDLAGDDLALYDAIVIGSRAYEADSALARHNDRLLEYVERGGLVLVQYQQYQFVRGGFAPYSLEIARPHDRITDETTPVRILDRTHPAFVSPNLINDEDWQGWPQERGLYFPRSWDAAFEPLLAMADPGGEPVRGALLVARYGQGTYIYTGLSFFRALPAGVPGAYRVFLNLLGLSATHAQ
jgi:hypothetical protein